MECRYCGKRPAGVPFNRSAPACGECYSGYSKIKKHEVKAKKRGLPVVYFLREEVYDYAEPLCGICLEPVDMDTPWIRGEDCPGYPVMDHMMPLAANIGPHPGHSPVNAQLAHASCNAQKKDHAVMILQGVEFPARFFCCVPWRKTERLHSPRCPAA
ncbi:hypothetical protein FZ103_04250 [Streptomonospora sp. PA3]|uniref:hypothetical protein n=1 Tax=Streptomonospora sp. PA3 TaxID=2607326 RepID=UPI0012DE8EEA|nr:hypothetical protein [Streptomonospora sp. PA3]MUL40397.1 hypothetical protein [Streptomonospora sp. PA3]